MSADTHSSPEPSDSRVASSPAPITRNLNPAKMSTTLLSALATGSSLPETAPRPAVADISRPGVPSVVVAAPPPPAPVVNPPAAVVPVVPSATPAAQPPPVVPDGGDTHLDPNLTLAERVAQFQAGGKRARFGQLSDQEATAIVLKRSNPDSDLLTTVIESYGVDAVAARIGKVIPQADPGQAAAAAPPVPQQTPVEKLTAEVDALENDIVSLQEQADFGAAAAKQKEWFAKRRELDALSRQETQTPVAQAPAVQPPPGQRRSVPSDPVAYQQAHAADWQKTIAMYGAANLDKAAEAPLVTEMEAVHARLVANDDPILYVNGEPNPEINSKIAQMAAANINLAPLPAGTAAAVTSGVPGPTSATPRPAAVQPQVRADVSQMARRTSSHQLSRMVGSIGQV